MMKIDSYRQLDAWLAGMDLALAAYSIAACLPASERFELARQMRRAAVSVPSNVAEGQGNGPGKRYLNHVRMALGSLAELDTQAELALRLGFTSPRDLAPFETRLVRTRQLLHGLARSLRQQIEGESDSGQR